MFLSLVCNNEVVAWLGSLWGKFPLYCFVFSFWSWSKTLLIFYQIQLHVCGPFPKKNLCVIFLSYQGAAKIILTARPSGNLKLACTSPNAISASPRLLLTGFYLNRVTFKLKFYVAVWNFSQNFHLPVRLAKDTIH